MTPTLLLARDGVVVRHGTLPMPPESPKERRDWTVPTLVREACAYLAAYPTFRRVQDETAQRWVDTCGQWPILVEGAQRWLLDQCKLIDRSKAFRKWVEEEAVLARKRKLDAYARRVLMEEIRFLPNALDALAKAARAGWTVFLLSVQSEAAAAGYTTPELLALHRVLTGWIHLFGGCIAAGRLWPYPLAAMEKPSAPYRAMIEDVLASAAIDPARCWFVVDSAPAAEAVGTWRGMRALVVRTGRGGGVIEGTAEGNVVADLREAVGHIEREAE